MQSAIHWFEICVPDLDAAVRFYESVLAVSLRREAMGPSQGAVFPYVQGQGVGGALLCGPTAYPAGPGGIVPYLDGGASLDATLARVTPAGGNIAVPRQALPPGMGFIAHITDPFGNRIGLHALNARRDIRIWPQ